ncbi:hypothetical protein AX758_06595 [Enterococcus mundtii]|uniref:immunoglobulin-like domain-containing protein n=1 Tax=Enterococcus mundtii TaxID=53346 RepID=UPI0007EECABD|nr:immunoglobulin-like domain-containing protein [Enterococcus mundtii]OBS60819.1 hypothetical protein AX758_06595 [Enterococcus mundtii]
MAKKHTHMKFGLFLLSCSIVWLVSGCKPRETEVPQTAVSTESRTNQEIRVKGSESSDLKKEDNSAQLFEFASQFRRPMNEFSEATIRDETKRLRIAYLETTTVPQIVESTVVRSKQTHQLREFEQTLTPNIPVTPEALEQWQGPIVRVNEPLHILPRGTAIDPFAYFTFVQGSDPNPQINYTLIDPNQTGYQTMQISAIDSKGNVSVATVTFLFNHSPIIQKEKKSQHIAIGSSIDLLAGVSAYDEEDGELTAEIQVETTLQTEKEGSYEVIYSVTDQFGASTSLTTNVTITNEAPMIVGPNQLVFPVNQSFSLLDYFSASDQEDGAINLTSENILASDFDPQVPGNYSIRIGNVVDRYGKRAIERTVHIQLTNEAPTVTNTHMTLPVFSEWNKESYLATLILGDREDSVDQLQVMIDVPFWQKIDTSRLGIYRFPLQVQDTHGKITRTFGSVHVVNEPPVFSGIEDKRFLVGEEKPDLLAGISVTDREEKLSIADVEVIEEITWDTPGSYPVYLSIKDSFTETRMSFHVSVVEKNPEMPEILSE